MNVREETLEHIREVQKRMLLLADWVVDRSDHHDATKLQEPEWAIFSEFTPKLRGLTYGSDEYKAALEAMGPALQHHYANNAHHPEFFEDGVDGMDLVDLLEMICDWYAATKRHADGDIEKSLEINRKRFGLSGQMVNVLRNTVQTIDRLAHCEDPPEETRKGEWYSL